MGNQTPKYQAGALLVRQDPPNMRYSSPLFVLILGLGEVNVEPLFYERYQVFWLDDNHVEQIDVEYIDRLYVLAT